MHNPMSDDREEPVRLVPTSDDVGKRLDVFLVERLGGLSRTRLQSLIEAGRVRADSGVVRKPGVSVDRFEWIEVRSPPPLESEIPPEDLPIEILHEDRHTAVVVKPAGTPTHPTSRRTEGTLVNALLFRLEGLSGVGGVLRPGIVHRLDRVTSGLIVVAKTDRAHADLSAQFKERTVRKTYRALCLGRDPGERGTISGPVARHPTNRRRMVLGGKGRKSITEFRRVAAAPPAYGLLVRPVTGRTHQIRVHLESIGCPVVLDTLYGYDPKRFPLPELRPRLRGHPGILLHAEALEWTHPVSGRRMSFSSPVPEVFALAWRALFGSPPVPGPFPV